MNVLLIIEFWTSSLRVIDILVFKDFGEQSRKMLVHYFIHKNVRYFYLNNKLLVRNLIFDRNTYLKRYEISY